MTTTIFYYLKTTDTEYLYTEGSNLLSLYSEIDANAENQGPIDKGRFKAAKRLHDRGRK